MATAVGRVTNDGLEVKAGDLVAVGQAEVVALKRAPRYEYREIVGDSFSTPSLVEQMNEAAREGWRFVAQLSPTLVLMERCVDA